MNAPIAFHRSPTINNTNHYITAWFGTLCAIICGCLPLINKYVRTTPNCNGHSSETFCFTLQRNFQYKNIWVVKHKGRYEMKHIEAHMCWWSKFFNRKEHSMNLARRIELTCDEKCSNPCSKTSDDTHNHTAAHTRLGESILCFAFTTSRLQTKKTSHVKYVQ